MSELRKIQTKDFLFDVQSGEYEGFKQIRKYGSNPDVDNNNTRQYIWDGEEEYQYPSSNETIYIISDNNTDNMEITVTGLIDNSGSWDEQDITVNLNGNTAVEVGDFIRVFRMRASNSMSPQGEIFATINTVIPSIPDTDIRAAIRHDEKGNSRNSSLMAMYTVPSGKTAFVYRVFAGVGKNKDAEFSFQTRPFGKVFFTDELVPMYERSSQFKLGYERVEAQSDIRVEVQTENNNTRASASIHMLIVDNDKL